MRVCVVVASKGRPSDLGRLLASLEEQDLRPTQVIVSVTSDPDLPARPPSTLLNEIRLVESPGSSRQRNAALRLVEQEGGADLLAFFDDDLLLHPMFLAKMVEVFRGNSDIVGAEGQLLADGAVTGPIPPEAATALLDAQPEHVSDRRLQKRRSLYGCNMVVRANAAAGLRFDEALPLYGYLEDRDFSVRLARRGELVAVPSARAVHLGAAAGRTGSRRLGYSQVANVIYLHRKGTFGNRSEVVQALWRPVTKNLALSLWSKERSVRRERARGNLRALNDLRTGALDPRRILDISP